MGWRTIYDATTGEVLYSCEVRGAFDEARLPPGQAAISGDHDGETHWINPETKRPNKRREATISITPNRITGIPPGSKVMVRHQRVEPVNGEVLIAADLPEDVPVTIMGPRLARTDRTVTCTPGVIEPEQATIALSQDYAALRRKAYDAAGLTVEAITFAQLDGDTAEVARITAARAAIKARIPKRKAP